MKTLLLTCALLIATTTLFAQQHRFADSTAKWNILETFYGFMGGGYIQTVFFEVKGDTVLNNNSYQQISYSKAIFPLQNNGLFFMRKDTSEKVFGRINADSSDYLLYDFSKTSGDTFSVGNVGNWNPQVKIRVDSTATSFAGVQRKVQYVTALVYGTEFNDVFVEGIGGINSSFVYPGTPFYAIDGEEYSLLCHSDNDTLVYRKPTYNTCSYDTSWVWIGINNLTANGISVYPNPATGFIQVQLTGSNATATFELTDLTGRAVLTELLNSNTTTTIPVAGISKGMYLYNIRSQGQRIGSGKLLIE